MSTSAVPVHVDDDVLRSVAYGTHYDPHSVLGAHQGAHGVLGAHQGAHGVLGAHQGAQVSGTSPDQEPALADEGPDRVTVRVLRPGATSVAVVTAAGTTPARHELEGIWVAVLDTDQVPDYRIEVTYGDTTTVEDDPYRFWPTLGEVDLHLIGEGRHERLWQALGANVRQFDGELGEVVGTAFAVWAPTARAVRVIGEFNFWQGRTHAMRSLGSSGVWELFVPGLRAGTRYKFEILGADGHTRQKADPMARLAEVPPATASIVVEEDFTWSDQEWMSRRARTNPHDGPMSIYEVHLGSWRWGRTYRQLATELVEYLADLHFTHVELMPVAEHPFSGSWGYQVTSYYAPTSRFGGPDDFRFLVDALHRAGIGVIVDWVPAHFPKDEWALGRFDGTPLYEDPDPLRGEHQDWGTYVFNFGRREVRNFLVANSTFWLEEFHVDGLRVDAVASMLYLDYSRQAGQWRPNQFGGRENLEAISFLQEANATSYRRSPGIVMIAEESTAWPGVTKPTSFDGLGFGLKWNMGWMNDTLRYLQETPINRRYHHNEITFSMVYAFSEQFVLPLSHDEVVHGKGSIYGRMPGDHWQRLAGCRALYLYQWTHPGKQLVFMGDEFAQGGEWTEQHELDWFTLDDPGHQGVRDCIRDLNRVYRATPALWRRDHTPDGFQWLDSDNADGNLLAYLRYAPDEPTAAVVVNFSGVPHEAYRLPLPDRGRWREVINTDSPLYGGSGVGNLGEITAEPVPHYGRPFSASIRVPPMGGVVFVHDPA